MGRLPIIAVLKELTEEALVSILTQPKNALVKQYAELFAMEGVKLTVAEDALKAVAKKAMARKTGARGLRSICEDVLQRTMFDLPSEEGVAKVVVTKASVEGKEQPKRVAA